MGMLDDLPEWTWEVKSSRIAEAEHAQREELRGRRNNSQTMCWQGAWIQGVPALVPFEAPERSTLGERFGTPCMPDPHLEKFDILSEWSGSREMKARPCGGATP